MRKTYIGRHIVNAKATGRRQNPPPPLVPLPITARQLHLREVARNAGRARARAKARGLR